MTDPAPTPAAPAAPATGTPDPATATPAASAPVPTPAPPKPAPPQSATDDAKVLAEIKAAADELGITPGQLKGRLDASRKWEERAKKNAPDLEDLATRLAAVEVERDKALAEALRVSVATDKGVPAGLLSGSTKEELEAAADQLLAFKGATPTAPPAVGQGNAGVGVHGDPDPIKAYDEQIAAASAARDFPRVVQLKQQRAAAVAAKT